MLLYLRVHRHMKNCMAYVRSLGFEFSTSLIQNGNARQFAQVQHGGCQTISGLQAGRTNEGSLERYKTRQPKKKCILAENYANSMREGESIQNEIWLECQLKQNSTLS